MTRLVVVVLLLCIGILAAAWIIKNPEERALDEDARANAPCCFVTTSVGTTHYQVAGSGSRVAVLVHGFSVPSYIWDSTFVALSAAGYRVIRYDMLGRGWSDRPDLPYDATTYNEQLLGLLDSLHVQGPVDLFGLSFGGLVVSQFTADHPDRVRTLTYVDPVVNRGSDPGFLSWPLIGPYVFQVMAVPSMPAGQPTDFLHAERFPGWEDRYREQMKYRGFGRALRRSREWSAVADFPALHERIKTAGTPVLLIWGRQDETLPFSLSAVLQQRIPTLEFVAVDSSGHLPQLEQAALFNATVLDFLARHAPADPATTAAPRAR